MRTRITRSLVALIALIAFSVSATETVLAAACAPVDDPCDTAEMCVEIDAPSSHAAHAQHDADVPESDGPPHGADCPMMVAGVCASAAPLPVQGGEWTTSGMIGDGVCAIDETFPPSLESHGLLRPPIA